MQGHAEIAEQVLTSIDLVELEVKAQDEAMRLLGIIAVKPELAIVTTFGDNPAIQTYFRSKKKHADEHGFGFTPMPFQCEDEALDAVGFLNEDDQIHGIVIQLPLLNDERKQELCDGVAPLKDVDALSSHQPKLFQPPTALAAFKLAEYHTNNFEGIASNRVAVVGALGKLVGTGAVDLLQRRDFDPRIIDKNLGNGQMIETLGRDVDLIITATGRPGLIQAEYLERDRTTDQPLVIIDAGIGIDREGKPAQDLDPLAFNLPFVRATKRTKAVGPLAVAYMYSNVARAALMQHRLSLTV
jgi:methylenetetrahydrofolate dehydrogenase (NADP+)/methenyltetrahydrofolate cyclohydrolase